MARFLALTLLLAVLFVLFRFAMGLRYAKRERERAGGPRKSGGGGHRRGSASEAEVVS